MTEQEARDEYVAAVNTAKAKGIQLKNFQSVVDPERQRVTDIENDIEEYLTA